MMVLKCLLMRVQMVFDVGNLTTICSVLERAMGQEPNIFTRLYNLTQLNNVNMKLKKKMLSPPMKLPFPKGHTQVISLPLFKFYPSYA